jgi:hypothetical protein
LTRRTGSNPHANTNGLRVNGANAAEGGSIERDPAIVKWIASGVSTSEMKIEFLGERVAKRQ